ncbi:hypothetical protein DLAC_02946 [Tieghemostelium lacteum]|uniref:Glutathione S-transferase n=1 Tax=Tieghemostelium lacteum TaxID=361077 RepID=A0A152A467_TIELA|nr:hypothetical protein DLAC_02946 [Tieghemostelium lacteum]|eukprot:KYR00885.1 hypothetical protein DLAC_02946 [Tieghemostelium lacteum]
MSSAKIIIYGDLLSQPVRAVVFFCILNNIPHTFKPVVIGKGENQSDEYAKINPFKKVPAMQDGDIILYESHTILRYLAHTFRLDDFYHSRCITERCRVDTYLDWHHLGLRRYASTLFFQKFLVPRLNMKPSADFLKEAEKNLPTALEQIETIFLKDQNFLCGIRPTIADFSCFCELKQLGIVNYDLSKYKTLSQWMKKMENLHGYQESHKTLNNLITKLNQPPQPKL